MELAELRKAYQHPTKKNKKLVNDAAAELITLRTRVKELEEIVLKHDVAFHSANLLNENLE